MMRIPSEVVGLPVTRIDPAGYSWAPAFAVEEHAGQATTAS
jgi:hypothetical protein